MMSAFKQLSEITTSTPAQLRLMAEILCALDARPTAAIFRCLLSMSNWTLDNIFKGLLNEHGGMRRGLWAMAMAPNFQVQETPSVRMFTNFGRLPLELREEIWRYVLKEERVVEIIWKRTENPW